MIYTDGSNTDKRIDARVVGRKTMFSDSTEIYFIIFQV